MLIVFNSNCNAQIALSGDSLEILETKITMSIDNELWLDSNSYSFFRITLSQAPIDMNQSYSANIIDDGWGSSIYGIWVKNDTCYTHPLKYIHEGKMNSDESKIPRVMHALFLVDDFEESLDSLEITLGTQYSYRTNSQMFFKEVIKTVKIESSQKTGNATDANKTWYTKWLLTNKRHSDNRYTYRQQNGACPLE
jgi:hypothetical protein